MVRTAVYVCRVVAETPELLDGKFPEATETFEKASDFDVYADTAIAARQALAIKEFLRKDGKYVVTFYIIPQFNWYDESIINYKL